MGQDYFTYALKKYLLFSFWKLNIQGGGVQECHAYLIRWDRWESTVFTGWWCTRIPRLPHQLGVHRPLQGGGVQKCHVYLIRWESTVLCRVVMYKNPAFTSSGGESTVLYRVMYDDAQESHVYLIRWESTILYRVMVYKNAAFIVLVQYSRHPVLSANI